MYERLPGWRNRQEQLISHTHYGILFKITLFGGGPGGICLGSEVGKVKDCVNNIEKGGPSYLGVEGTGHFSFFSILGGLKLSL